MMDPFNPRPDDPNQGYEQFRKDGTGSLWLLAFMAGAVGVLAVLSAI
jgi:hypothetical protein